MPEVQEIIKKYGKEYKEKHKILPHIAKTMGAIEKCRTGELGAQEDVCDNCGRKKISYNSCRNRHCPNCQTGKKLKWIEARKEEVLNIKYYHIVFTIPSELYLIAIQNQEKIYKILFKASAETLQELAKDSKYLGAEIGFFSILHTWGQNLMYHPHVHMVVTGGGLTKTLKWKEKEEDFFIPVKVMSKVFRGKFLEYMKKEKLEYYKKMKEYENPAIYNELMRKMYEKDWIVYCKEPFKNANSVIEYLGRYTHRVAISNERIVKVEKDTVTFKWRDYKDENKMKEMTITIQEFIRRFLIHILPPHFMKIRYYGILGNKNKKKKLLKCKILTRTKIVKKEKLPALELLKQTLGKDFNLCPQCKKGHMLIPNTT